MLCDCTPFITAAEGTAASMLTFLLLIYKYNITMNYLTDPYGDRMVKDVPIPVQPREPLPDADLFPSGVSSSPASINLNS